MSRPRPSLLACAIAGALVGLVVFGVEGAWILRENAIGLDIDLKGPFAALMQVVRPMVPPILFRIAAAYAVAGVVGGLYAGLLVQFWGIRSRWLAWPIWIVELAAIVAFLCVDHAIVRPALFDDVAGVRGVLAWLVDHGDVTWVRIGAGAFLGVQLVGAVLARRVWRTPPVDRMRFASIALIAIGCAFAPWTSTFERVDVAHGSTEPAPFAAAGAVDRSTTAATSGSYGSKPKLVVIIGIDAFRPDRLGRGVAPNLDAFLSDATRFTNAWTPIGQTEPAWRALVTSRWPTRTGLRYPLTAESRWLPAPTFPSVLNAAGFSTTFATDCSRFNFQTEVSGFTTRRQPPRGAVNFVLEKLRFRMLGVFADNAIGAQLLPDLMENRALAGLYDPSGYAKRLSDELVRAAKQGPALFAFHSTAAHFPGDPTLPFYRKFVRADAPLPRRLRMFFSPIATGGAPHPDGWGREESEALYDELLAQGDAQVGVIFDALKREGLYDDAAIILFSDHGESFHADHPELAGATPVHGARISNEEYNILFAVKLPKARAANAPKTSDALVRLIDIAPTVLDLAGAPPLEDADGVSLVPVLEGKIAPPQRLYAETGFTHASPGAFDPSHLAVAPRTFDIYRVREDGVVEITESAHDASMREKDFAAYDGATWIVRSPLKDGTVRESCTGTCPAPELSAWLDARLATPVAHGAQVAPGSAGQ